jgi:hypothetical protein
MTCVHVTEEAEGQGVEERGVGQRAGSGNVEGNACSQDYGESSCARLIHTG